MLANSITLGTAPDALAYVKRFTDTDTSTYSVQGLPLNAAKTLKVSHEAQRDQTRRSMASIDHVTVDPGTSGAQKTARLYLVLQSPPWLSQADKLKIWDQMKTLISDNTFRDGFLNGEV